MNTIFRSAFFVAVCSAAVAAPVDDLRALMDDMVEGVYEQSPIWAASTLGRSDRNDELPPAGPEATAAWRARQAGWLERAREIPADELEAGDRLNLDLVIYQLELAEAEAPFHPEQLPVNSISGPQYWLPQLASFAPLRTGQDHADYLARLRQIPRHLEETVEQMRLGMAAGRVPPKAVIGPAVQQAKSQADAAFIDQPERSGFYKPFLSWASVHEGRDLAAEARAVVSEEIVPAYEAFAAFLEDEYLPACRESVGISEGVDGPAAYELAIRRYTTLDMTADEVHELGLGEVARIRAEMMEVIERSDWATEGPGATARFASADYRFDAFVNYLRTDPRFYYTDAEDLLDGYRAMAKEIDAEMPKLFGLLPRLPYGVRAIPPFAARFSPTAYYYSGSVREGRAGYFMANTYALDQRPRYNMMALTLHEGVPGHHHQIMLEQEMEGLHPLRKLQGFTVFSEGWGLYAEHIGLDMGERPRSAGGRGLYEDPYQDFGRLNFEMWRACRLVIDSGIHAKGWTRQEAIDYLLANTANTEVDVIAEIDRYIGWPGQALAYKVGELKIRELRAEAENLLGGAFDLRDFHDELLRDGALPLPVLEEKMRRWMREAAGS